MLWFMKYHSLSITDILLIMHDSEMMNPMSPAQESWSCPSCSSLSSSQGCSSTGTWWWLRCLNDSCTKTKTCCGSEIFLCCSSLLKTHLAHQFSATFETILPWWASKHRNIGKIPQQSCRMLKRLLTFPLRCMWPDDALFSGLTLELCLIQGCIFLTITFSLSQECL